LDARFVLGSTFLFSLPHNRILYAQDLWTLLRLKFAVATDFELASNFDPANASSIGSPRLEFDIVQGLLDNVEGLLRSYATSLDEDVELLRRGNDGTESFPRRQAALVLRIEIKRILHTTILECLNWIADHFAATAQTPSADAENGGPNSVQNAMFAHWQRGMRTWRSRWQTWKAEVNSFWSSWVAQSRANSEPGPKA